MRKNKRRRSKKTKWQARPGLFAPSDPEEFKFCFALMNAAAEGKMSVERPGPLMIEGLGEVSLNNTPMNRGLLAMTKHLRQTHPREANAETPIEVMAVCNRVMEFGGFVFKCKDPRMGKYVKREQRSTSGAIEIEDALVEAAATAAIGEDGFDVDSILSIADTLAANGTIYQ